jgi:hypothetical protein
MRPAVLASIACLALPAAASAQAGDTAKPRARDLGISALIGGTPGALDAITDVAGVEVGHTTLVSGEGALVVGKGPVRTGVTVVHPRGPRNPDPVFGAWFTLNGNGEMTGTTWLEESGILEGPIAITNTHSVGTVRDAILKWQVSRPGLQPWGLPVVAETYDGTLNDINGFHVKDEHVFAALDRASGGRVSEGNVGGGTGMVCHQFKGGIGTASRVWALRRGPGSPGPATTRARPPAPPAIKARSSWSWRRMRPCFRTSSSAWPRACPWASGAWVASAGIRPATSFSPSPPRTRRRRRSRTRRAWTCSPTGA